jgi:hypothetical protein
VFAFGFGRRCTGISPTRHDSLETLLRQADASGSIAPEHVARPKPESFLSRLRELAVRDPGIVAWIVAENREGSSLSAMARALNEEAIPTAHGGARWYPSTVRKVLAGQDAAKHAPAPSAA